MTGHQTAVMWIGLLLLGAYLLTNTTFKNALFTGGKKPVQPKSLQQQLQQLLPSTPTGPGSGAPFNLLPGSGAIL